MKQNLISKTLLGFATAGVAMVWTFSAEAQPEPVLYFDGIESVVETELTASDLGIEGSGSKTIEAWVRPRAFNWGAVIQLGNPGPESGYDFSLRAAGQVDEWMGQFWGADLFFFIPGSLDQWTHLAITYDGATVRAYGNGDLIVEAPRALDTQDDEPFQVGRWDFDGSAFDGAIRDVRVWSVVRSQTEIQTTMNASPAGEPGLELWWPMEEGGGDAIGDASGNNRNGTIFAAQWQSQQFEFDQFEADFTLDFGTAPGKDDELSLLRNRPDHFAMEEDALRMTTVSGDFVSSTATAPVINRGATQNFVLESEVIVRRFPDARASRVGLVALGGPHDPPDAPFDAGREEDDYFTFAFYPGADVALMSQRFPGIEPAGNDTAVIAIARGFDGEVLAAERWEGRKPLAAVWEDDFETPATDENWWVGGTGDLWEIGEPTFGSSPRDGSVRVAATNLDGPITGTSGGNTDDFIRSPVIDLDGIDSATLGFWENLDIDDDLDGGGNPFHEAFVRIVDPDGDLIAELDVYTGNSGGWRQRSFHFPEGALGKEIRVEFRVQTDGFAFNQEHGWMIDEVSIATAESDDGVFELKAEGGFDFSGQLDLAFTLTDAVDPGEHSQTISTRITRPLQGNLFGLGGRLQAAPVGGPEFDFPNLSMTLGDDVQTVPTIFASAFDFAFGSGPARVAPDRFVLIQENEWELTANALRVDTGSDGGDPSAAVTLLNEFRPGSPVAVDAEAVLSDLGSGGRAGLVLFGESDPAIFNTADDSTYYTFQYDHQGGAGGIAVREGMNGPVLYSAAFPAPVAGATYRFSFSGEFNHQGNFEFTASLSDGLGGDGTLSGELAGPFDSRAVFGFGAARGGGDVWNLARFAGNTRGGVEVPLVFNGASSVIATGVDAEQLGVAGNSPKTIEAWVHVRSFNWGGVIELGAPGATGEEFSLRVRGGENQWRAQLWDVDVDFTAPGSLNRWTHIAVTYDGSTVRAYANGQLRQLALAELDTQPGAGLRIGAWLGDHFDGAIRDVRVWNVVRTEHEIQEFMHASPVGEENLAGWWRLDEGLGDTAYDASGNNRDGTIFAADWTTITGNVTVARPVARSFLEFNGVDARIESDLTATDLNVAGASSRTIEAWLYARDFNWGGAIQLGAPGSDGQEFMFRPTGFDNQWQVVLWGFPDFGFEIPGSLNAWTHIAITYDGSDLRAFANGEQVAVVEGITLATGDGQVEFRVGVWEFTGDFFDGFIRDVRVWSVARTQSQIQEAMDASPAGEPGLELWWPLDEGEGTVANDGSDNVREGAIVNGEWGEDTDFGGFASATVVRDGTPILLSWNARFATTVNIDPGMPNLATSGREEMVPPGSAVTTFALAAADKDGNLVANPSAWVRSVPEGFETLRYVRFELPDETALRDPGEDSVQLSQFRFFRDGVAVVPVAAVNPGGDNPTGEGPGNLLGDDPETKWRDFNKAHFNESRLVFDFGTDVEIDAYQLGTAGDAPGRDPQRWRMYGRGEGEDWRLIEYMHLDFPPPTQRGALTQIIPLGGDLREIEDLVSYNEWLDIHFPDPEDRDNPDLIDPGASPAGDGVANAVKFAFGLDPRQPFRPGDLPVVGRDQEGRLTITYRVDTSAEGVTVEPEAALDLNADQWFREPGEPADPYVSVGPGTQIEGDVFEFTATARNIDDAATAFLRVSVTLDVE